MRIDWSVEQRDTNTVREFVEARMEYRFVAGRIQDNVSGPPPRFTRNEFWRVMLGCLLTSQQRSGPGEPVTRFLQRKPFEPALAACSPRTAQSVVSNALTTFGGIRFHAKVSKYAAAGLARLEAGDWARVEENFEILLHQRSRDAESGDARLERKAAAFIDTFEGFGPKQSRNLWQWLGLTRFEIPLDSRVINWLNENCLFPFQLSAQSLQDEAYYSLVMDGVEKVCAGARILPCVFDAAVFSDGQDWGADELEY